MNQSNLFIQQLEELAKTMSTAKEEFFNMASWYRSKVPAAYYNPCGYVACICGEQAIRGNLKLFPCAKETKDSKDSNSQPDLSRIACEVANDLDESYRQCYECAPILARSVYSHSSSYRQGALSEARIKGIVPDDLYEILSNHPHITTDSSPKHATSYLTLLVNYLKEIENETK